MIGNGFFSYSYEQLCEVFTLGGTMMLAAEPSNNIYTFFMGKLNPMAKFTMFIARHAQLCKKHKKKHCPEYISISLFQIKPMLVP